MRKAVAAIAGTVLAVGAAVAIMRPGNQAPPDASHLWVAGLIATHQSAAQQDGGCSPQAFRCADQQCKENCE